MKVSEHINMKKFNINEYIYIQINETGWKHLRRTVGEDYIKHCINAESHRKLINGEIWHRLQARQVFDLLPIISCTPTYNTNVMFDDDKCNTCKYWGGQGMVGINTKTTCFHRICMARQFDGFKPMPIGANGTLKTHKDFGCVNHNSEYENNLK